MTEYLTINEVAQYLKLTNETVYALVHKGDIPAVRVGRQYRVSAERLNDYLTSERTDVVVSEA